MSEQQAPVLASVRNRVGHLTLNRPSALNTLDLPMVRLLCRHLWAWEQDPQIVAVTIRGAGEKAFCAGGDIRMLYDSYKAGDNQHELFLEQEYALDEYLHGYTKPVLALLDGFVLGGGMGLAQAASLRVITERTRMGMPEVGIGFFPDVGGSYFLPRLPGELGTYLGITGCQVRAADALYANLADYYLPSERLAELDACLDHLNWTAAPDEDLQDLLADMATERLAGSELKACRQAIDEYFALPDVPAIRTALQREQRPELQDWAEQTVKLLDSRSPLAMATTLELLRRGRYLSLAECFALELHLDYQWFDKGDLMEGVRALIIDKDKRPRWNPPTLAELEPARVQAFFNEFQRACGKPVRTA
ncbi:MULTISPECIES: enoyl-CoA hydratase/isomerase family protein [Pseudomonas]|uniref:3-hydroxyisobutyryl-CoA hydrolase n=2 Tax=Pseudomonas TaxID=286 RepID=A0A231FY82_PSEJE|nr:MULTISPECIES: enoyl-CoA hydratase/isomerase family protein [Pseudomonas]OXR29330.1 crotonase [Pseudomonas jessenii]PMZ86307.1 enoyl-CoA hydratase/isomerase family protein [Pseudomonas sp. FW215-T2]PNA06678.1 enoyl-CoA hydratase/isomerase family protein [Pseudomonas sp. FW215-R3]PNB35145.1 enoyl-CoA hydratase/isomerase family protein [Pseudomonas sp. FW305-131]SEC50974.1 Enoyl-CoA hydratase/carnithine racemase [Pseudomonas jessenii]